MLTQCRCKANVNRTIFRYLLGLFVATIFYVSSITHNININIFISKEQTLQEFVQWYLAKCSEYTPTTNTSCACLPATLEGRLNLTQLLAQPPIINHEEQNHSDVMMGGVWRPSVCEARQRVAIIVPFRDRHQHLTIFLHHMHGILHRQQLDYSIFIVEQTAPNVFNRAALSNVGFLEARMLSSFDCYIFHDVDMLAEDDRIMYTCRNDTPTHFGAYINKFNYGLPYGSYFGGIVAFTEYQFTKINGYTNKFYGWGGEDDDLRNRVKAQQMEIYRYPNDMAHYSMIKHDSDKGNPLNEIRGQGLEYRPQHYPTEGLSNTTYPRVRIVQKPLYTLISVALPDQ